MKTYARTLFLTLAGCLLTNTAFAETSDWKYEATIYLFAPETNTSITTPAGTLDGSRLDHVR